MAYIQHHPCSCAYRPFYQPPSIESDHHKTTTIQMLFGWGTILSPWCSGPCHRQFNAWWTDPKEDAKQRAILTTPWTIQKKTNSPGQIKVTRTQPWCQALKWCPQVSICDQPIHRLYLSLKWQHGDIFWTDLLPAGMWRTRLLETGINGNRDRHLYRCCLGGELFFHLVVVEVLVHVGEPQIYHVMSLMLGEQIWKERSNKVRS